MNIREAILTDIPEIQIVRNSVRENQLSDPRLVTDEDVADYITRRGKGWVCEQDYKLTGFAIVSILDKNVWALFMHPDYEGKGSGKLLHEEMMNWYFSQTNNDIWLSTAPGTRAASFYIKTWWEEKGITKNGEIRFEMTKEIWLNRNS